MLWQVIEVEVLSWEVLEADYLTLTSDVLAQCLVVTVVVSALAGLVGSRTWLRIVWRHSLRTVVVQHGSVLNTHRIRTHFVSWDLLETP